MGTGHEIPGCQGGCGSCGEEVQGGVIADGLNGPVHGSFPASQLPSMTDASCWVRSRASEEGR